MATKVLDINYNLCGDDGGIIEYNGGAGPFPDSPSGRAVCFAVAGALIDGAIISPPATDSTEQSVRINIRKAD